MHFIVKKENTFTVKIIRPFLCRLEDKNANGNDNKIYFMIKPKSTLYILLKNQPKCIDHSRSLYVSISSQLKKNMSAI